MENYEIEQKNNESFAKLAKYPEDSPEYRKIVSRIVENNVGLVKSIVKKYFSSLNGSDDLISEGFFGLLKAIKLFDPEKGTFSTYAGRWIKGRILNYLTRERIHNTASLEDNIITKDGDERKWEDVLASAVNVEEEFVEKDEKQRQMTWLREHINQLPPTQKQVLNAKYLSTEWPLTDAALAKKKKFDCSRQNISTADTKAIENLRKMYDEEFNLPEEIKAEKIKTKKMLKSLILAELPLNQQKTMLCKFYSPTKKTDEQVAQEVNLAKRSVVNYISVSCKKLCTLCDSIQDTKQLKNILEFSTKEC